MHLYTHIHTHTLQHSHSYTQTLTPTHIHSYTHTNTHREILREAYRILPPNGAIAIMDMDPESPAFQRVAGNPFAFAAFKSTEPWIREYMSLDLYATLRSCGFTDVRVLANSPRHRTVVAFKK